MMWDSILWGAGVAVFNGVGTLVLVRWSLDKNNTIFMMAILGGMFARLFLIAVASIFVLKFAGADPIWYLGTLAALFFLFLALEVVMVLRANRKSKEG